MRSFGLTRVVALTSKWPLGSGVANRNSPDYVEIRLKNRSEHGAPTFVAKPARTVRKAKLEEDTMSQDLDDSAFELFILRTQISGRLHRLGIDTSLAEQIRRGIEQTTDRVKLAALAQQLRCETALRSSLNPVQAEQ